MCLLTFFVVKPQPGNTQELQTPALWATDYQNAVERLHNGNHVAAAGQFQALWESNPREFALANAIGAALDSVGRHEEATAWYRKALELNPSFTPAHNNLGLNYASRGLFEKAVTSLKRATELDPKNQRAFYNLGLTYLEIADFASAAAMFGRARDLAPQVPYPLLVFQQARALFGLARYKQVVKLLQHGTAGNGSVAHYLLLGSAQALAGDLPGAVSSLQKAARTEPRNPQSYYRLALVFLAGYRDEEARACLAEGLKQLPGDPLLLNGLATVSEVLEQRADAIANLEESLHAKPAQSDVWGWLADLYAQTAQRDKALEAYARAMKLGASTETLASYAGYLISLRRLDDAEKVIERARRENPGVSDVWVVLGKLQRLRKNYPEAEKSFRRALELAPDDAGAVHFFLATVLLRLGKDDEAKEEFALTKQLKTAHQRDRVLRKMLVPAKGSFSSEGGERANSGDRFP